MVTQINLEGIDRTPVRRLRFVGNPPHRLIVTIIALVMGIVGALGVGVILARPGVPAIIQPVSLVLLAAAGVLGLGLLVTGFVPPKTWHLYRKEVPPEVLAIGLEIAKNWRDLAVKVFPPQRDLVGNVWYPGLRALACEDGALLMELNLPPFLPSSGRLDYLQRAADEIPRCIDVFAVAVAAAQRNRGDFTVIVRDYSLEKRHVNDG